MKKSELFMVASAHRVFQAGRSPSVPGVATGDEITGGFLEAPSGPPDRTAVSLIGFLVAVAALTFVLIPFYLAFQTTRTGTVQSLNSLVAANVASSVLDRYRSMTFSKLEALMLHVDEGKMDKTTRYINGPFQTDPPSVTVREPEVHRSGGTVFDAEITLSYFPDPNPDPDDPSFNEGRQRMLIAVRVTWRDRVGRGIYRDQEFTLKTMVHNEKYAARPSLARLTGSGGGR